MKKLLITGASGLLGINLSLYAQRQGYDVCGWTNAHTLKAPFETRTLDITDKESVGAALEEIKPDLVVHTAALANLEACDKAPKAAYRINAEVPGELAYRLRKMGVPLVHISTDAVFDGSKGNYREIDMPNPINSYAHSKLMGEEAVRGEYKDALIARVVFYGWSLSGKRSLAEFFYNRLKAEDTANGFIDMIFTPLYVEHLASLLLEASEKGLSGLYHFFGSQALSKYAFGVSLAREFGFDETLVSPIETADSGLTTPRSLNLSMNTDKLVNALGHDLPGLDLGLKALHLSADMGLRERLIGFAKE